MTSPQLGRSVLLSASEEEAMARRRLQRRGHVFCKGPTWFVRYWDPTWNPQSGEKRKRLTEAIADATGPNAVRLKRDAQKIAWDSVLASLNEQAKRPASTMALAEFVKLKFLSHVVAKKKPAGQQHYKYIRKLILPALGTRRLCDIGTDDIEDLLAMKQEQGFSGQTVLHVKNGVSAIFRLAKKLNLYAAANPASGVELPEIQHRKRPTLSAEQAVKAIAALPSPAKELAILSVATSLGPAELLGLRRKHANLTDHLIAVEGEALAPHSLAIRENFYRGAYGSLKRSSRRRNIGLSLDLSRIVGELVAKAKDQDPEAPLFQGRTGTPVDAHNISNRVFLPLSKKLGFSVTWYSFRRAHSTMAALMGVPLQDRQAVMGHADARLTMYYDVQDVERRRPITERIAADLLRGMQPSNQISLELVKPEGGVQ